MRKQELKAPVGRSAPFIWKLFRMKPFWLEVFQAEELVKSKVVAVACSDFLIFRHILLGYTIYHRIPEYVCVHVCMFVSMRVLVFTCICVCMYVCVQMNSRVITLIYTFFCMTIFDTSGHRQQNDILLPVRAWW